MHLVIDGLILLIFFKAVLPHSQESHVVPGTEGREHLVQVMAVKVGMGDTEAMGSLQHLHRGVPVFAPTEDLVPIDFIVLRIIVPDLVMVTLVAAGRFLRD